QLTLAAEPLPRSNKRIVAWVEPSVRPNSSTNGARSMQGETHGPKQPVSTMAPAHALATRFTVEESKSGSGSLTRADTALVRVTRSSVAWFPTLFRAGFHQLRRDIPCIIT